MPKTGCFVTPKSEPEPGSPRRNRRASFSVAVVSRAGDLPRRRGAGATGSA